MPNRFTIPGLKAPKLTGWSLVGVLGVGLAVIALFYGTWRGNLDTSCTVRVQADRTAVLSDPVRGATVLQRVDRNTEFGVDRSERQRDGYWQLDGGEGWISGEQATATQGSRC